MSDKFFFHVAMRACYWEDQPSIENLCGLDFECAGTARQWSEMRREVPNERGERSRKAWISRNVTRKATVNH
jgi:hypothetical protein